MTNNTEIFNLIITSIKINMMNFKTSLSSYANFAFVGNIFKRLISISNIRISFVFAIVTTISKFMTIPFGMIKFFITSFAITLRNFSSFRGEITRGRAEFRIIGRNSKLRITKFTILGYYRYFISKDICACNSAINTFSSICFKRFRAIFANLFHMIDFRGYMNEYHTRNSLFKKEVTYGL